MGVDVELSIIDPTEQNLFTMFTYQIDINAYHIHLNTLNLNYVISRTFRDVRILFSYVHTKSEHDPPSTQTISYLHRFAFECKWQQ